MNVIALGLEIKNKSIIVDSGKVVKKAAINSSMIKSQELDDLSMCAEEPTLWCQHGAKVSIEGAITPGPNRSDERRSKIQIVSSSPFLLINYKDLHTKS